MLLLGCQDPVYAAKEAGDVVGDDLASLSATAPEAEDSHGSRFDEAELSRTERSFDILPSAVERAGTVRALRMRARSWDVSELARLREQGWNLAAHPTTEEELLVATAAGLHRISASEVEFSNDNDLYGIWQVVSSVRARHCDNTRLPSGVQVRISQCMTGSGSVVDVGTSGSVANAQETHLSAMRRLSRYVMGVSRSRTRSRVRWTANVTLACDEPLNFPTRRSWSQLRARCERHADLARRLVTRELRQRVTSRATPVAWGGRCEDAGGACDDPSACRRGLARIPNTGTSNALWCRPGSRGCAPWVERGGVLYSDALCAQLGVPPGRPPSRSRLGRVMGLDEDEGDVLGDGPLAVL